MQNTKIAREPKFDLPYNAAMAEAMKSRSALLRRYRKWHRSTSDHDDILAAAYEGILLAWKAWKGPEVSAWSYTAFVYADLYAKRESNKRKSVVTTNVNRFALRKTERDEGVFVTSDDGETSEERFAADVVPADQMIDARQRLDTVMGALAEAIPASAGKRDALARDIILKRIVTDSPESASTLATAHGCTSTTVYKVEAALRAAIGA